MVKKLLVIIIIIIIIIISILKPLVITSEIRTIRILFLAMLIVGHHVTNSDYFHFALLFY